MKRLAHALLKNAALAAALVLGALPAVAAESPGAWSNAGPMTTPRTETSAVALDGKIYIVAGQALGREDSPMLQSFDPANGTWRDLAPLPKGVSHIGVAAMNGKIYVAGGFTANVHKNPQDQFIEYDVAGNMWRTLTPLTSPRGSVGLAAVGGKLHVIGGRGLDGKAVDTHEIYDPAARSWTRAAPLPKPRDHLGIVALDGKIHVFGGRYMGTADNYTEHDVFDPARGTWSLAAPMPTARSGGAAVVYKGMIFYVGGECKNQQAAVTFDETEAYDPKADRWMVLAKHPTGLHGEGAAALGDTAYVFGGDASCGGGKPSNALYAFRLP